MVVDRVVQEEMGGGIDLSTNQWWIPVIERALTAAQD
jgi:hypothetical protein